MATHRTWTDHRFVFIGGLHRSGTTLIHDLLANHPQVSGLTETGVPMNEGMYLQDVLPPEGRYRKLWPIRYVRRIGLQRLAEKGYGGPGRFAFDIGAHLTESSPLARAENGLRIYKAWEPYWNVDALYLIEKSPPNLIRTRLLQSFFPDSYFIAVYRHPVPVSFATQRWWRRWTSLYSLFQHWLYANDLFRQDAPHLKRILTIRYEELIANPTDTLGRVYAFLGIDPPAELPLHQLDPAVDDKYFDKWRRMGQTRIGQAYQRVLVGRFEHRFAEYGYSLLHRPESRNPEPSTRRAD